MTEKEIFFHNLERELEFKKGTLNKCKKLKNLDEWDSLAILNFILYSQSSFKKKIKPEDIIKCITPSDLFKLIK